MSRKDFYVFRHGETDLNKQKRWQGSGMDFDLNANGIAQAQGLVEKLRDKDLEIIYSSPLKRAFHTAEVVGEALHIPVVVEKDLRECFYGEAEGQLIVDLQRDIPEVVNNWANPDYWDIRFPEGESKKEALTRVLNVLSKLTSEDFKTMGIAIHGGTMAAMLNHWCFEFDKLPNCAAFHLVYENGKWFVEGDISKKQNLPG